MKENKLDCLVGINQRGLSSNLTRQQRSYSFLLIFVMSWKEYFLAEAYGRKREETRAAEVAQWIAAGGFSLSWRMSV
jgi:hypothetical protein